MRKKKKQNEMENIQPKDIFRYYEINILKENDVIEVTKTPYDSYKFEYDGFTYTIDNKMVYFIPKTIDKTETYIPTLYYKEKIQKPLNIRNENKGIPARALYLLWNHMLYSVIVTFETDKTNKLIVLMLIANAVLFCIRLYFVHGQ